MKQVLTLTLLFFALNLSAQAQNTKTVWVVRHAEKLTDNPKEVNPNLSVEGFERAEDLKQYLAKKRIEKIYATPFLRTKNTAEPLAKSLAIATEIYDAKTDTNFVNKLKALPNKNILVVGHSNTVLEIVKLLGAETPLQTLNDDDYDFLFKIKIRKNKASVKIHRYGKSHHSTK
jgi:2,3-bisphosphoglycerate-dependent phosphoglycerate mutase